MTDASRPTNGLLKRLSRGRWGIVAAVGSFLVLWGAGLAAAPWLVAASLIAVALAFLHARDPGAAPEPRPVESAAPGPVDPLAVARSITATLPDPLVLLDNSGQIVFQNEKAEQVLGRRERGVHISSAIRAPQILEALRRIAETGETVHVDYTQPVPVERHFEVFLAPVAVPDAQGAAPVAPHLLMVMRDLTQQQRIERMRADFVANASHELRTPLASLIGFVETLQGPAREDPRSRDRFLSIMHVEARRMSRLIDDLLGLSRIELNAHLLPTERIDVSQVVGHVIDALAPLAAENGVEIRRPAGSGPLVVSGDYDEVVQVFQNLIQNAIKYGQSGGRVDVAVRPAAIDMKGGPTAGVMVAVRDYGPGIAAEHIPRLTERFYRVDATQSREKGGTGLGLAIVKHILNRHRGVLTVASVLGSGSTFTVSLPLDERAGADLARGPATLADAS